ncbi:MAG: 23S rRNA (guanosine(2251)-2'-O)-methyltransferase RlmB [Halioglobus sp.]|nr:23S rRNA (guanosine(2251)-2'-O)-methyltransferase RlmB [Halioglobus sp.]
MADRPHPAPPLDRLLTVYGRKAVRDVLLDDTLQCHTLHLASSNRAGGIVGEIRALAGRRGVPLREHSRETLSRISKNGRQDQGVALDVLCPAFASVQDYLAGGPRQPARLLALDGITNPQNLGMIIRSAAAGGVDGILLPRRGNAALGPLVIKASAAAVFRAPVLSCGALDQALQQCRDAGAEICVLAGDAPETLFAHRPGPFCVYVLGNESEGVSAASAALAQRRLSIPMANGVESLNVAVAASLVAFLPRYTGDHASQGVAPRVV